MAQRSWRSVLAAAAVCVCLGGTAATAQPEAAKAHGACRSDVQKLCKGVQPGGGRIRDCLDQHMKLLSAECQKELTDHPRSATPVAGAGNWAGPCMLDISTFCKDIPKGGGQVRACLQRRMDALSPPCKEALQPKKPN